MISFRQKYNNQLLKITSLNSISVLMRVATGLISSKMIAYFIGPSGMAIIGNFRNFISSTESIGLMGLTNGIIKSVAEKSEMKKEVNHLMTTVFYFVLTSGIFLGLLVFLFSRSIGKYLFETNSYQFAIQILAILLPFQLLNSVLITFLNGLGEYKKVIGITIITYVLGVFFSFYLIWNFMILGALTSISILSFVVFFITVFFMRKRFKLLEILNFKNIEISLIKEIIPLGFMSLFSAIIIPIVYINIRKFIINFDSLQAAGYYESMNRISSFYMMFISTLINLYFLPEFSKTLKIEEDKRIMSIYFKQIIPLFALGLFIVFLAKNYVVKMIFTEEFLPVTKLFIWQLLGDFFKASSLILGIQFYAKKMVKSYFVTEIISLVILFLSSYFCINFFGLEGAVFSYCLTYLIYFVVLVCFFNKRFGFSNLNRRKKI